jgi:hypothetical protein
MTEAQTQARPAPTQENLRNKKTWTEIPVSRETRQKLAIAKAKYGFRSYDELISRLLEKAGYV